MGRERKCPRSHSRMRSFPLEKPTSLTINKLLLESRNELGYGVQVYLKGIRSNMCRHRPRDRRIVGLQTLWN